MLERLSSKLARREKVFGFLVQLRSTHVLRSYSRDGVDFVLFDLEHGPFNIEQIGELLQVCRMLDIPTIVRVQDAEYHLISKVIDAGADGIMLPRTETPDQVQVAVDAVRFSPIGRKGCGGGYQFRPGESFEQFQKSRIIILQVESPVGVKALPAIFDAFADQIAGVVVGPYDMSVQAGTPLDIRSAEVVTQVRRTIQACMAHGVSVGIYCDSVDEAVRWHGEGMNILWIGSDIGFVSSGLSRVIESVAEL